MKQLTVKVPELPYALEEAMNRLRVNVKFCGENTRKIAVLSSVPDEGKSFVSIHLWRLLCQAGFKTVLVDVDLRKSVLAEEHAPELDDNCPGLGHYLSGQAELEDCMYETSVENGVVIPCTSSIMNPSSLLEDPKFKDMLDRLSQDYRYVILDCPPLFNVADGAQIASLCDGALLVVRAGYTQKKYISQSIKQIGLAGCTLLGTVLNFVDAGTGGYGKYRKYGKYYGRYYGKYGKYYGKGKKGASYYGGKFNGDRDAYYGKGAE